MRATAWPATATPGKRAAATAVYYAAIGAALVLHRHRITQHSYAKLDEGFAELQDKPWMLLAPALTMMITLLCLNFIGDGLRDALDPKER